MQWLGAAPRAGGVPRWSRGAGGAGTWHDGGQLAFCALLPSLEVSLKCQRCLPSLPLS